MKKERFKLLAVIAGAFLFNLVFWQEKMALNTVLYDVFILVILFFLYPEARRVSTVRWLTLGHLLCLAMIVVNNTMLSKVAFTITLALLAGFVEYIHRSVWFAGGSILVNGLHVPMSLWRTARTPRSEADKKRNRKVLRFLVIPVLLLVVFLMIYSSGNSIFSNYLSKISLTISHWFENFFEVFSLQRIFFLLFGLYITGWIILKSRSNYFESQEKKQQDELVRVRIPTKVKKKDPWFEMINGLLGKLGNGMMALKNMNTVGLISLVLLNILLLVINTIDIIYVWFGFEYGADVDLYAIIHEGTDMLIISILLAMVVLVIFFKGNLNFYKANKWLKYAAYTWIIQNLVLVISVFLRDYHYININGLAYKRIGVLFYLALVLVGLTSVFWKIYAKKTNYFLFRVNAWALIILLVGSATVNWDHLIASYNIKRQDKILMPVDYMVTLSNKAFPVLDKNIEILRDQIRKQQQYGYTNAGGEYLINRFRERQHAFLREQQDYTWLSYNMADSEVIKYFNDKKKLTIK
jgi:hypothetical protein